MNIKLKTDMPFNTIDIVTDKINASSTKYDGKGYITDEVLNIGVAEYCRNIAINSADVYKYTMKGNLVAIITNGSSVMNFGDLGALASKPVMEEKSRQMKKYADIDAFDIELNTTDIDVFVRTVITMMPTFGAINLEDIKAPDCFEIEKRLIDALDIPVMHNDQHGVAVVTAAALLNACEIAGKQLEDIKIVINGAGTAAMACAEMYVSIGVKRENLIMIDSNGVISTSRIDLDKYKQNVAVNSNLISVQQAVQGADVFVGLSKNNMMSLAMLQSMAQNPIVFALDNPNPEIAYGEMVKAKYNIIYASVLNDIPNHIDSVMAFPYIYRAALDIRATKINMEMKKAAVYALASLAKQPNVSSYNNKTVNFGRDYFIPKYSDRRLMQIIAPAVAKAAIQSGVARLNIENWKTYSTYLYKRMNK